jgi:hypothetical protein
MLTLALSILWQASVGNPNAFNNYLILAYFVMGGIGLGYIISLALRQRNLQQDIKLMQRLLREDENHKD